jgi:hypothetical protein
MGNSTVTGPHDLLRARAMEVVFGASFAGEYGP